MTKGKTDNRRPEVQQIGEDSYTDYLAKQAAELDKLSFVTKGLHPGRLQMLALRHPGWNYPESAIKELLKSDKRLLSVRARESKGEIILSACILPTHPDLTSSRLTANQMQLSREATTRSEAVQQVWHLYQLYKATNHKSQINHYWHYENAHANVEVQLRKNVAENHASIRGVLAALLLWRWVSSAENKRAEAAALGDHPYKSTLPISLQWGEISLLDGPNQFTERLNDLVEYLAICKLSMRERWKEINKTIKAGVRVGDEILLETLETTPSRGDNEDTEEPRSSEQWLITLAPLYVKMTEVNQAYLFNEMQRISELPFETADDHLSALEAFDAAFDDNGDAYHGIFSTPSNIARLAVALSEPKPGERIYDPCFGSGNFLIEANRQVEKNQEYPRQHKNMLDISGVEINRESYLVGLVRMLLSGINTPRLKLGNSLEIDEPSSTEQQGFDLVIANPPINAKPISKAEAIHLTAVKNETAKALMLADAETIGKIEKLLETESFLPPRFEFPTNFTDGLFIQHALSQLKPNGRAVIIVPEGFLSRGGADRDLRRNLLERGHIEAVVGLPAGSFAPHTRVKGSLLLLRKSGGLKSVRMADSTSLFYSKTRDRAPVLLVTTAKQLAATITRQVLHEPQELMPNADEEAFSAGEISRAVWEISVADLSKTDWDLTPRRREPGGLEDLLENLGNCGQITPLSNVVKVITGRFIKLIDLLNKPESDGPSMGYIRIKELNNGRLSKPSTWLKPSSSETERRWALRKGDILLSKSMAIGKTAIVHEGATGYLAANSLYVLRADQERLDPEFLLAYIASAPCTAWLMSRSSGAASQHINSATLETLMIPLPTLPMQAQAAEQYRDFGTDVLTFLKGGSGKKDDERLTGWLDRLESRIPRFITGAQETPQLSEFEFIAQIAHEARNWATHDMFNDSTARWLLPFSQALIPLSGISQIPPGPGLLSVLQEAERGLLHAIPNILGPLPAEAHVRSIAERLREWLRSAITDLVDSAAIELHSAPSSLTAGSVAEFTIELENRGSLPLRNLLVEASPSWGSAEVPYLAERSVMPINLHGNVQKNSGLVTFKLKWHALTLSGQRAKGTVEFAIRVVEPDVPILKIEEDFGGSPYVCGSPLEPRYGHEVFFGREGLIEQISRQIATHGNVVLLEGNRRAGKTSILKHLEGRATIPGWLAVYTSLQGAEGDKQFVGVPTTEVFRVIATEIAKAVSKLAIDVPLPNGQVLSAGKPALGVARACRNGISDESPFHDFKDYLETILSSIEPLGLGLVLMLDEFDKLQEGIDNGVTSPQVPENIRFLIQTYPTFSAILTGSRRLKRLREEYWSVLYGLGTSIPVTSLDIQSARNVVTQPVGDRLTFSNEAIERVVEVTARQPYLMQCLCNRIFELALQTKSRSITLSTVNDACHGLVSDNEHFASLWMYASHGPHTGRYRRQLILLLCARSFKQRTHVSFGNLREQLTQAGVDVGNEALDEDLAYLRELDLINFISELDEGEYRLTIPIMADWIEQQQDAAVVSSRAQNEAEEENA